MVKGKKEFDANSGLGFMRFIVLLTLISLLLEAVATVFIKGSTVNMLHFSAISEVISIASRAAAIWLILRRKNVVRVAIPALLAIDFVNTNLLSAIEEQLSFSVVVVNAVVYGLFVVYFLTSRRVKAVMVNPLSDQTLAEEQAAKDRQMWDPKSKDFWLRLILYFFVFSIAGHWMEMGVQVLVIAGIMPGTVASPDSLTWRDNLNPFFIYGIAFVVCGLVLYPVYIKLVEKMPKKWQALLLSFLVNALFCTIAELILGLLFNQDHHAWDYSNQFLNWQGQICFLYTFLFGILASIMAWGVYPLLERQFSRVKRDAFRIIFVISLALFVMIYFTFNVDLGTLLPGSKLEVDVSDY